MKVTVIVPTYNESVHIAKCLDSIIDQTYAPVEIIAIDDGSTDNTVTKINQYKEIKLLIQNHLGPAHARNYGAQKATGDILVFIDADMVANQNYIKNLTAPIVVGNTKGTFTKDELVANFDNPWARHWNYQYTGQTTKSRIPSDFPPTSPVFRAILRSEFLRVNGYDLIGYSEDWTLSQKLGYRAKLASNAIIYHYNPDSHKAVFNQAKWLATRQFKFGELGRGLALIRASLPVSFLTAIYGAIKYQAPFHIIFKLIYDFGLFIGIIKFWLTHQYAQ